jgi:hypothetical protein
MDVKAGATSREIGSKTRPTYFPREQTCRGEAGCFGPSRKGMGPKRRPTSVIMPTIRDSQSTDME